MARLRALLSPAVARSWGDMLPPVSSVPVTTHHARSAELEFESPRRTRRAKHRMRPVRVLEESVGDLPTLTIQDLQGAIVYDCRPPLLPVSLQLEDIGPLTLRRTVVSASLAAPPREDCMAISGVSPEGVAIPELGVAPLVDSETDELPTPEDSPFVNDSSGGLSHASGCHRFGVGEGTAQCVYAACYGDTYCGPCGGFSGGSVFISGASSSCHAERRPRPYVADFSTPGGSRQSDPGCLSIVPHFACLLRL